VSLVGIDLGVHKIAMYCITEGEREAWSYEAPHPHRDLQLLELGAMAHDFALLHGADTVWIEKVIIGNNRKYSIGLAETMGAVLSDLGQVRLHNGLDIRTVDNKAWKKALIGNGNASKEQIRDYIDVAQSAYAPLCGDDQDLYDACCIALYGRLIMDRATHLQLQP
jgi:Holliday junction resolvasome RuvABC endonuclease subunit